MRKISIFLLLLALILGYTSVAIAFRLMHEITLDDTQPHLWPQDGAGQHNFIHWDLREFPDCEVPWSAHEGTEDLPGDTEFDEVKKAFDSWEAVAPSVIGFNRVMVEGAQPPMHRDGNNMIGWGGGLGGATLAATTCWAVHGPAGSGRMTESDILFNDDPDSGWTWIIGNHNLGAREADVQSIAAHEIGHFIGLGHSEINGEADTCPTMWEWVNPFDGTTEQCSLEQDDRRGCNFLYTPDIGDAPDDPYDPYPSLVHGPQTGRVLNDDTLCVPDDGAEHIFGTKGHGDPDDTYLYEWLGDDVSGECESRQINLDTRDDGVVFGITRDNGVDIAIVDGMLHIDVTVSTAVDATDTSHDYDDHHLYLNIWVDWNNDDNWGEGNEHVVGYGEIVDPRYPGHDSTHHYEVEIPQAVADTLWIRVRLDWGEDCGDVANINGDLVGPRGAAQFGEVEDYLCQTLWGGTYAAYFWRQPPNDPFINMLFEMPADHGGCLEAIEVAFYQDGSKGTPDPDFYVWLSDGLFPLDDNPPDQAIADFHISYDSIAWYPAYTLVLTWGRGIVFDAGEKFHLGCSHAFEDGDTLAFLSDDGDGAFPDNERSSGWYNGAWEAYWPYQFLINAVICLCPCPPEPLISGDCNGDNVVNVSDVVYLINYLFVGGSPPPTPLCIGDVNCDGGVNVSDVVYLINYLFIPGSPPPCPECCDLKAKIEEFPDQRIERVLPQERMIPQKLPQTPGDLKRME